jgi:RNA polymerase sigma-70 factor (ECF subfamily)
MYIDHQEPGERVNYPDNEWLETQIHAACHGDNDAFTNIVQEYQTPVFNLCYRMLGAPDEAEEAAQESFWRAYQSLKKYDPHKSFATWLLSIAAHYCIDLLRKRRMTILSMDILPENEAADHNPGPEASFFESEEQKIIRGLLTHLNSEDRAAIIMRYWYEFSEDEISKALSLSVSAVKSRLHRARLELARLWQTNQKSAARMPRRQYESPAF